ncbi:MAG: hypothetical protein ACR2M0_07815 [Chloroflexia bacterium]
MKKRLLSLLGVGVGLGIGMLIGLTWQAGSSFAQTGNSCQSFPQTGHTVCGRFLVYWQAHGGLAQQGYPLSQVFTETSDLNGKPYAVQYFERAVFESHPENQPPYDVLLSQLGTYLGHADYAMGFPTTDGGVPSYDNHDTPAQVLKSYYNAINRKEYERAYSYFQGAPNPPSSTAPPYPQFVAGYSGTVTVSLALGPVSTDAGAGNVYASLAAVIEATHTTGNPTRFAGCYFLHHVSPGISQNPQDAIWHIVSATLAPAPAGASLDTLLAQKCTR